MKKKTKSNLASLAAEQNANLNKETMSCLKGGNPTSPVIVIGSIVID